MPYEKIKNVLRQNNLDQQSKELQFLIYYLEKKIGTFPLILLKKNVLKKELKFLLVQYIMS